LESRYAAATVEVSEALRERECRSIDNADVIEREVLAGFAAPLDSYLRVAAHGRARKLETASTGSTPGIICGAGLAFARAWYSWLEGLAATVRKYCLRPLGVRSSGPVRFRSHRNQCGLGDTLICSLSRAEPVSLLCVKSDTVAKMTIIYVIFWRNERKTKIHG